MKDKGKYFYFKRHKKYAVLLLFFWVILYIWTVPFVYTPPALTQKILDIYKQIIIVAESSDGDWVLRIRPSTKKAYFIPDGESSIKVEADNVEELRKYFSSQIVQSFDEVVLELHQIDCCSVKKKDGVIFFVPQKKLLKPCRPGVAYSLEGVEPKTQDIRHYLKKIQFEKIAGNWFFSKDLVVMGPRLDIQYSIPFSVFDFSKTTKDLDLLPH